MSSRLVLPFFLVVVVVVVLVLVLVRFGFCFCCLVFCLCLILFPCFVLVLSLSPQRSSGIKMKKEKVKGALWTVRWLCVAYLFFPLVTVTSQQLPHRTHHQQVTPLLPHLSESIVNEPDGKALTEFFEMHACPPGSTTCILDLLSHSSSSQKLHDDIAHLRRLATSIMQTKDIQCGSPKVLGKKIIGNTTTDLEFCFWKDDYVSIKAMKDFSFETEDWQWVVRAFQDPKVHQYHSCLAFLDVGVNVADWAVPITGSLPTIAYFGIEGSPPTAAIAAANMLTMIRYQKHQEHMTDLAPRALVPFPVMSSHSLQQANKNGGVCFSQDDRNVGGQRVVGETTLNCKARSTAGAACFGDVLHNLFAQFQPSRAIYIAKFDIQGFEFQALASTIPWLVKNPPCYMMLEFSNKERQNYALMELLVEVVGYDAVWRSSSAKMRATVHEQPPSTPHWSKQSGKKLWAIYEKDMEGQVDWSYMNYIFGFADQEACIKRLVENCSH